MSASEYWCPVHRTRGPNQCCPKATEQAWTAEISPRTVNLLDRADLNVLLDEVAGVPGFVSHRTPTGNVAIGGFGSIPRFIASVREPAA